MEISLAKEVKRLCNERTFAVKKLNKKAADKLATRLEQLKAAPSLAYMAKLPGAGCHQLKGERKEKIAVDLYGGLRLVFQPDHHRVPRKPDGGLDWIRVIKIYIVEIVDYHRG